MAKKELAAVVHVYDDGGTVHVFGPGDDVPGWAAGKITNPKAWQAEETADEPPRTGRGSSREAWVAYAEGLGIAVPDDASKDDIVALVDSRRANG